MKFLRCTPDSRISIRDTEEKISRHSNYYNTVICTCKDNNLCPKPNEQEPCTFNSFCFVFYDLRKGDLTWQKEEKEKTRHEPVKVIILDNNPLSIAHYMMDHPGVLDDDENDTKEAKQRSHDNNDDCS